MNLAFYGTLRDPEILQRVTGEELNSCFYRSLPVKGWICLRVEGATYPLLRSEPTGTVIFHLYHDCSEVSWRRLVEYEGSEYAWIELQIDGRSYRVFMAEPSLSASSEVWDLAVFQLQNKSAFLKEIFG